MVRSYWRRVHSRAFSEAAAIIGITSRARVVVALLLVVGGIIALLFWGSADAARDEMVVRIAFAAILAVVFPLFYLWRLVSIPAILDDDNQKTIQELRDTLTPRIMLSFSSTGEFITRTPYRIIEQTIKGGEPKIIQRTGHSTWIRVRVFNDSDSAAKDCRPLLLSVQRVDERGILQDCGFTDVLQLAWSNLGDLTYEKLDLLPQVSQFFDIMSADDKHNKLALCAKITPMRHGEMLHPIGTYRVTAQVVGTDSKSSPITIDVTWTGRWDDIKASPVY